MRIALLTEGGYPYARSDGGAWCDRLVRGLTGHQFEVYALARTEPAATAGRYAPPRNAAYVRTLPLHGLLPEEAAVPVRARRRRSLALARFRELAGALAECGAAPAAVADRFAAALYDLAELAREDGGLPALLRSEHALRALEDACRAPGVRPWSARPGPMTC